MSVPRDCGEELQQVVRNAHRDGQRLLVGGSGSKGFLVGGAVSDSAALLSVVEHAGVIDYRPDELVVTARCGTPLRELNALLDQHQQILPFDPPLFGAGGTVGGAVAAGLSGPARPWRGSVRDCLLGVEMLNGLGERLRFGGQVMKNVAGYDVSRLQAGAFGSLGLLLSVSLRLLPKPTVERTCCFELDARQAHGRMRAWAREPLPVTGLCYVNGVLRARLSGSQAAVAAAAAQLGGDLADDTGRFWGSLRDHDLAPMKGAQLVRVSVPAAAAEPIEGAVVEWGGALRWFAASDADTTRLSAQSLAAGGYAARFGEGFARRTHVAMTDPVRAQHIGIKRAFDPDNLLNPGLVDLDADRSA